MIHTPTANAPLPPVSLSQQTVLRREDPWKATSFSGMEASPINALKGHNGSCHSPPNVSFKLLFTPHTLLCALPSNACWSQGPQITSDAFEMTKRRLRGGADTKVTQAGGRNLEALAYDAWTQVTIVFYFSQKRVHVHSTAPATVQGLRRFLTHFYSDVLTWSLLDSSGKKNVSHCEKYEAAR